MTNTRQYQNTQSLESLAGINGGNLIEQGGEPRDDP